MLEARICFSQGGGKLRVGFTDCNLGTVGCRIRCRRTRCAIWYPMALRPRSVAGETWFSCCSPAAPGVLRACPTPANTRSVHAPSLCQLFGCVGTHLPAWETLGCTLRPRRDTSYSPRRSTVVEILKTESHTGRNRYRHLQRQYWEAGLLTHFSKSAEEQATQRGRL